MPKSGIFLLCPSKGEIVAAAPVLLTSVRHQCSSTSHAKKLEKEKSKKEVKALLGGDFPWIPLLEPKAREERNLWVEVAKKQC